MKDGTMLHDVCAKLMNGEGVDCCAGDLTKIDNMLYDAFGMSSGDILAEIRLLQEGRE